MASEPFDEIAWGDFRIFLAMLEDVELEGVSNQLRNEIASRWECDNDCARLFFSSLTQSDLESAQRQIQAEQDGRIEDAKILRLRALTGENSLQPLGSPGVELRDAALQRQISLACGGNQRDECVDRGRRRGSKEQETVMTTFTISPDNKITMFTKAEDIAAGEDSAAVIFDSQTALARISAAWPMSRFVEIYNGIDNGTIKKFANRQKAAERIWRAIQPPSGLTSLEPGPAPQATQKFASTKGNAKKRKSGKPRKAAKSSAKNREAGGKRAEVVAMMRRARGATLVEIMSATGWQAHTVRGLVSILGSKDGLKIESSKNASGERTYRIPK